MEEGMREGGYAGVVFALLAAIGFSAKAILVKLAYQYRVDTITLLALRMAFAMPFSWPCCFGCAAEKSIRFL